MIAFNFFPAAVEENSSIRDLFSVGSEKGSSEIPALPEGFNGVETSSSEESI